MGQPRDGEARAATYRDASRSAALKEGAKHCQVCGKSTREGKPFCSRHVDQHPYVRALLSEIAAKEEAKTVVESIFPLEVQTSGGSVIALVSSGELLGGLALVSGAPSPQPAAPAPTKGPRRLGALRSDTYARVRAITEVLDPRAARTVLFRLQERRADMIPRAWVDWSTETVRALREGGFFPKVADAR